MTGSSHRSKRDQPAEASSGGRAWKKGKKLSTRVSVRNVNNCCDFGMPVLLSCSSCQKHFEIPEKKRKLQSDCTSRTCQCHQPCEHDANCLKMPRHKIWQHKLDEWFASNNIHRISSLVAKKGVMIAARPTDSNTMQSDSTVAVILMLAQQDLNQLPTLAAHPQ
jgi:hypothetical protein